MPHAQPDYARKVMAQTLRRKKHGERVSVGEAVDFIHQPASALQFGIDPGQSPHRMGLGQLFGLPGHAGLTRGDRRLCSSIARKFSHSCNRCAPRCPARGEGLGGRLVRIPVNVTADSGNVTRDRCCAF